MSGSFLFFLVHNDSVNKSRKFLINFPFFFFFQHIQQSYLFVPLSWVFLLIVIMKWERDGAKVIINKQGWEVTTEQINRVIAPLLSTPQPMRSAIWHDYTNAKKESFRRGEKGEKGCYKSLWYAIVMRKNNFILNSPN